MDKQSASHSGAHSSGHQHFNEHEQAPVRSQAESPGRRGIDLSRDELDGLLDSASQPEPLPRRRFAFGTLSTSARSAGESAGRAPSPGQGPGPAAANPANASAPAAAATTNSVRTAPQRASGRMVAPMDAMARFMGVLQSAQAATPSPALARWSERALQAFLNEPSDVGSLMALQRACVSELKQSGHAETVVALEQVVNSALRDPGPTMKQLQQTIREQLGRIPRDDGSPLRPLFSGLQGALASLPSYQQDPVASLRESAALLQRCQRGVREQRQLLVDAKQALLRGTDSLTEKKWALNALVSKVEGGAKPSQCDAVKEAESRLLCADREAECLRAWQQQSGVPADLSRPGTSLEELCRRAALVGVLARFVGQHHRAESDALAAALRGEKKEVPGAIRFYNDPAMLRCVRALPQSDRAALAAAVKQGASVPDALAQWVRVHTAPSAQPLSAAMKAEMELLRRHRLARAPGHAMECLQHVDHLEGLDHRLVELASQVTPAATERYDALYQRAFETLLVTRLIANCPASTQSTWTQMGRAFEQYVLGLSKSTEKQAGKQLRKKLIGRGIRPWDGAQPQIERLRAVAADAKVSDAQFLREATNVVASPATSGYDVVGKANMVRELWLSLAAVSEAPNQSRTNRDYLDHFAVRKEMHKATASSSGDAEAFDGGANAPRRAFGIMGLHQPLPEAQPMARAATQPGLRNVANIDAAAHRADLDASRVVVTGVSGSTNILLHIFDWAQATGRTELRPENKRDLALGAIQFVVQDGGHSMFEVMYVMDHALQGKHAISSPEYAPHSLAQLRALFADDAGVQDAFAQSAKALAKFASELPG